MGKPHQTAPANDAQAQAVSQNDGQTIPKPVFQSGDTPSKPLAEGSIDAIDFVNFFNNTYYTHPSFKLPLRQSKKEIVRFPPQRAGKKEHSTENCDPSTPSSSHRAIR